MTIIQAIIIGIVQGLTEFIPISSTAHLIFASRALDLFAGQPQRAEQTTAAIAVVQLGTLVAVLIYFAPDILAITVAFIREHIALIGGSRRPNQTRAADGRIVQRRMRLSDDARLGWLVIIGSVPVGVVGLLFKRQIEGTFTKNLWVIATMMVTIALLLALAEKVSNKRRGMAELGIKDALAVGCAQVLALIPGASRSGSTIMGGLFAGEKRDVAARFSFLLSIPAIAASGLLELKEAIHKLPPHSALPLAVATIVSGLVGYATIWFLLRYLRKHSTAVFIIYRLILGVTLLIMLWRGIIQAR
ncbi:MAG: UDP-diphosphatase [Acidobacteria bacterium]|nr:MAG: UDP-diphosphatase [Acidobacteriota bacterium]